MVCLPSASFEHDAVEIGADDCLCTEKVVGKTKEVTGMNSGEVKGKASELSGEAKGKAHEVFSILP